MHYRKNLHPTNIRPIGVGSDSTAAFVQPAGASVLTMNSHRYLAMSSAPVRPMGSVLFAGSCADVKNGESHGHTDRTIGDISENKPVVTFDIDLLPAPGVLTSL